MAHYDERLHGFEDRLRRDEPEHAGAPERHASRSFRPGPTTWLWLAVGVVGLLTGIFIGHGLLIAMRPGGGRNGGTASRPAAEQAAGRRTTAPLSRPPQRRRATRGPVGAVCRSDRATLGFGPTTRAV